MTCKPVMPCRWALQASQVPLLTCATPDGLKCKQDSHSCQGLPCLKDKYWIRGYNPAVLCIIHQQTKSTNGRYQKLGLSKTKVVCAASEARTSSLKRAHTCMATDPCFAAVSGSLLPHLDYLQGHGHAMAT